MKDNMSNRDLLKIVGSTFVIGVFIVVMFLLNSCKPLESTSSTNTNQSLITERFDSAFDIAGDNAMAKLLIRCDSLGNAHLESFVTEQGKRIRLELSLREALNRIDSLQKANAGKANSGQTNTPYVAPRNTPLLIDIECKEDSFKQIIRCQRERIAYFEEREKETKEPVKYIPDFYRNCTIGFFVLLVVVVAAVALYAYKNWGNIAAWGVKIFAKFF